LKLRNPVIDIRKQQLFIENKKVVGQNIDYFFEKLIAPVQLYVTRWCKNNDSIFRLSFETRQ